MILKQITKVGLSVFAISPLFAPMLQAETLVKTERVKVEEGLGGGSINVLDQNQNKTDLFGINQPSVAVGIIYSQDAIKFKNSDGSNSKDSIANKVVNIQGLVPASDWLHLGLGVKNTSSDNVYKEKNGRKIKETWEQLSVAPTAHFGIGDAFSISATNDMNFSSSKAITEDSDGQKPKFKWEYNIFELGLAYHTQAYGLGFVYTSQAKSKDKFIYDEFETVTDGFATSGYSKQERIIYYPESYKVHGLINLTDTFTMKGSVAFTDYDRIDDENQGLDNITTDQKMAYTVGGDYHISPLSTLSSTLSYRGALTRGHIANNANLVNEYGLDMQYAYKVNPKTSVSGLVGYGVGKAKNTYAWAGGSRETLKFSGDNWRCGLAAEMAF